MRKIPVILVTGFLGSGKTTLLRHIATDHPTWRLVFLVNEFAETDVDGATLAATGTPTQSVVGGSLFCECKASEFVAVMRKTVLTAHASDPLDAVIIETSGIADPEAIGTVMRDFDLEDHFTVAQVVTVVAPMRFPTLVRNLPNVAAQVQASDLVVINKLDLATADQVAATETAVRELQPAVEIVHAEHCAFAFSLGARRTALPEAALATCDANPFETETVDLHNAVEVATMREWLAQRDPAIVRVKGQIDTPEGWRRVEATIDTLEVTPSKPANTSRLVLIAHEDDEERLLASAADLRQISA